ncbi:MAG: tRNA adenylyl-/cytidylyl-transferase [Candidatus Collierbacteria bacterium GW2011_GWD2_45_10]|uniref:tRNA adenylyl-/cytidylyl-transferase n=1 Tax=Candidatus Collierbacteria bacterium GW2011_GWB2_44_22 TaxID=1618387 RepID=A0A0G1HYS9_9BACT|nr:MAG: tRNA adenylyl-/cytidylyl-transferase [Candidatus Collierbacteria bacterium GW2011_GWA2_44_13]KKT52316.1 MAG: tRNA adenylyl-/cytidylyl-transferase [Candidatus Collierbacteria bacterium GW2011_GWB2_44_22]KKT63236.1 MAG: tRNA adenylyl-/cytidylyl-transferase [Candidatus Collierbacteria bacterium GW2011_GWD1_44_27]KKT89019.1 MAG: tRNA adenylyl-/cytidylyl-transferase [Candidatus Collierbacteria bacterium GW2011_GWD2_45_10]
MYTRQLLPDEISLIPEPLKKTFDEFGEAGFEIYLVGGGVRNLILGKTPENCDLTTNATPDQSLEILKMHSPFYNNDFGTVSFNVQVEGIEELYEVTTYRSEKEYSDYRRPDNVSWGKTLEEDVTRRDFTINAIVIGIKNSRNQELKESRQYELVDMVDGLKDFEKGLIRAVGDPRIRFNEDALRMMRAIRFAAKLGFSIEENTLAAISEKSELLEKISKERVREEFLRILGSNYPVDGVRLLISTGLMEHFLPEALEGRGVIQGGHHRLTVLDHMLESLAECPSTDPIVRFATFTHDIGKPRSQRFKCRKCGKMFRDLPAGEADLSEEMTTCVNCGYIQPTKGMVTFYGHEVIGARMIREITERLKFNRKQIEKIETLVRWHMFAYQPEMTDASIRRLIRRVGKENINDMVMLRIADRKGSGAKTTSWRFLELQKRIGEQLFEPMEINDMVVNGMDVMEVLKVSPGPIIGKVLKELFDEVLEDTKKNSREYLLTRISELGKSEK